MNSYMDTRRGVDSAAGFVMPVNECAAALGDAGRATRRGPILWLIDAEQVTHNFPINGWLLGEVRDEIVAGLGGPLAVLRDG